MKEIERFRGEIAPGRKTGQIDSKVSHRIVTKDLPSTVETFVLLDTKLGHLGYPLLANFATMSDLSITIYKVSSKSSEWFKSYRVTS